MGQAHCLTCVVLTLAISKYLARAGLLRRNFRPTNEQLLRAFDKVFKPPNDKRGRRMITTPASQYIYKSPFGIPSDRCNLNRTYALIKASKSGLITSACVVSMPCG